MVLPTVTHKFRTELPSCSKYAATRRCRSLTTRAQALEQGQALNMNDGSPWVRVLRYPGGQVRIVSLRCSKLLPCEPLSQIELPTTTIRSKGGSIANIEQFEAGPWGYQHEKRIQ